MAVTERDIDKNILPIEDYIEKYYSKVKLDDWNYWMNNNISKAWNENSQEEFLELWGERMKFFDFSEMKRFYKEEDLSKFDKDVQKFISFLAGDSFFSKNKVTLEGWIDSKNFTNPIKGYEQDVTINQALYLKGGMNYIRKQLVNLHWWRF